MGITRRTFLKITGLVTAGSTMATLGSIKTAAAAGKETGTAVKKGMLLDSSLCIGCLSCSVACKKANKLPEPYRYFPETGGDTWTTIKYSENKINDRTAGVNLKAQCLHCGVPSCVSVCPTGAAYKRQDGIVLIDQDTCVGCKYCVIACPFGVPGLSEETKTARKCTFCVERVEQGKLTACAEACPTGAIRMGDPDELAALAEDKLDYLKSNGYPNAVIFNPEALGGLKVFYVLPDAPEKCGLPGKPKVATGDALLKWVTGLAMAGYLVVSPLRKIFGDRDSVVSSQASSKGVNKDA